MVAWFEIPVNNMERAIKFYEEVFDISLERHQMGELDMAWFPYHQEGETTISGSLVKHEDFYEPSTKGVMIYFTSRVGDLSVELSRVSNAGGAVLQEKKLISEQVGYMGLFLDSEGNRIALYGK